MYCSAVCYQDEVKWFAHSCPLYDICPPYGTIHWSYFYDKNPFFNYNIIEPYVYENKEIVEDKIKGENELDLRGGTVSIFKIQLKFLIFFLNLQKKK